MKEILLISLSGTDKPGVTVAVSEILSKYQANILDIGQAVIHDHLNIGILVEIPATHEHSPVLKDILFCAHKLDMKVKFEPISEANYSHWVEQQGKKRHIVTLLARQITAAQLAAVATVITRHCLNIDSIKRLSGRIPLSALSPQPNQSKEIRQPDNKPATSKESVEFSVRGKPDDPARLKADFMELSTSLDADIAFQEDNIFRRNRRLVCFDMDSTLIEAEVIDELAKEAGVGQQVAAITEAAMRGEMDFKKSFTERMRLLSGLDEKELSTIADRLSLTEGAEKLIRTLKKLGYKTAILSGGFDYFGHYLQRRLGIDYVFANHLDIENGKLTGKVVTPIVDGARKAELLKELADKEEISLEQVIAVGDGANDLPMLSTAGFGIAFRAKPLVKASAEHSIQLGLDAILYLIGLNDHDELLAD